MACPHQGVLRIHIFFLRPYTYFFWDRDVAYPRLFLELFLELFLWWRRSSWRLCLELIMGLIMGLFLRWLRTGVCEACLCYCAGGKIVLGLCLGLFLGLFLRTVVCDAVRW